MKASETKKGDIVSYYVYSGTSYRNVGRIDHSELCFAKIYSVGRIYATVITELGNRRRIRLTELSHAPEGEEYFTPSNIACSGLVVCPACNMNLDRDGYCPRCGEYYTTSR